MGFEKVESRLYMQSDRTEDERKSITNIYLQARGRVEKIFGPLTSTPILFVCSDEKSYRFIGGAKSEGDVLGSSVIRISPKGLTPEAMARLLYKIELKVKTGKRGLERILPTWFIEGLGIIVSDDSQYTQTEGSGNLSDTAVISLKTKEQWEAARRSGKTTRLSAYRVVKKWYDKAGRKGVLEIVARVSTGGNFNKIYSELGDRP